MSEIRRVRIKNKKCTNEQRNKKRKTKWFGIDFIRKEYISLLKKQYPGITPERLDRLVINAFKSYKPCVVHRKQ